MFNNDYEKMIEAGKVLFSLGMLHTFHDVWSIMPGETQADLSQLPKLAHGSFRIYKSAEGFIVDVHGAPDGSVEFNDGSLKTLADAVVACIGTGHKCHLVACFNGNRVDGYQDERITLIPVKETCFPQPVFKEQWGHEFHCFCLTPEIQTELGW